VVKRIYLFVHADNARAIRLYQNFGFVEEGRRRQSILRNGEYIDDLMMALLL
jgi:putative acetyltransferase